MPSLSKQLNSILRVSDEPFLFLKDDDIHEILTSNPLEYIDFLLSRLKMIATGQSEMVLPPKMVFDAHMRTGDYRVMPCITQHPDNNLHIVKIIGTNRKQELVPDQITVGKAFVIDKDEHFISHIIDGCLLSSARTGACAVIAMSLLSSKNESLAIVGAGRVGFYTALYAVSFLKFKNIVFIDIVPGRAQACAEYLSSIHSTAIFSAKSSLRNAPSDVLVLATTSATQLCEPKDTHANLTLSLGADINDQHELSQAWSQYQPIFVDSEDAINFGDLQQWHKEGYLDKNKIMDLLAVCKKAEALAVSEKKVFISTGSAMFDNLSIEYLLQNVD